MYSAAVLSSAVPDSRVRVEKRSSKRRGSSVDSAARACCSNASSLKTSMAVSIFTLPPRGFSLPAAEWTDVLRRSQVPAEELNELAVRMRAVLGLAYAVPFVRIGVKLD